MPITEKLHLPGSFTVTLEQGTPKHVRDAIDLATYPWSYIVVTDTHHRVTDLSAADMLSVAVYSGVYRKRSQDGLELNGAGLAVLLGDEDNKGDIYLAADFDPSTSRTYQAHVAALLYVNGITAGAVGADGSAAFTFKGNTGDTPRQWLDHLRTAKPGTDFGWRINPDGTFDSQFKSVLWNSGAILFSSSPSGRDANVTGLHAVLTVGEEDAEDISSSVEVDWNDGASIQSASTSLPSTVVGFDGAAITLERYMTNRTRRPRPTTGGHAAFRAWYANSAATALKIGQREAGKYDDLHQQLDITHTEYSPWRFYGVGDTAYVWDVDQGLVDTANQVQFRGEVVFPALARIVGHTTPIYDGYGVYSYRSDGAGGMEFYDLTDYVAFEDGSTKLEVGDLKRTLAG